MGLVMAMIVGATPVFAQSPAGGRRLAYQTDFDLVTIVVPAETAPFATETHFLPPALSETSPPRLQSPLRIRGRGVRVRLRIPLG